MFAQSKKIIYFAPHQDDELLTMGIDLCANIQKGHEVHVVLCTDGSKSNMRLVVGNGKACTKHEGLHLYQLTVEEFIQARDREFTDSCLALGVPGDRIHIAPTRDIDGSLTQKNAEHIIRHYLDLVGHDALVCTISPDNGTAQHRDHKTLGRAANSLFQQGVIPAVRFFVEPYHYHQICENPRLIPVAPTVTKAGPAVKRCVRKAIGSYTRWDPENGRYAVGYHSVTTEFDDFLANTCAYSFEKRNPASMTARQRLNHQHRVWLKRYHQKQLYFSMERCQEPQLTGTRLVHIPAFQPDAYKDFCGTHNVPLRDKDVQRIQDGSSFWCLVSPEGVMVSSGWLAWKQHFYIGETDYGFDMSSSDSAILFDFNTKPEYRGKGLYGQLLRSIVSKADGPKNFIIYTAPDNTASAKGILKAGFREDGALSAENNTMKPYLAKAGFTHIFRKNQLFGLRVLP